MAGHVLSAMGKPVQDMHENTFFCEPVEWKCFCTFSTGMFQATGPSGHFNNMQG